MSKKSKESYSVGDRVQYISAGNWKPTGTINQVSPATYLNEALVSKEMYTVIWDENKEESGWLYSHDLIPA